MLKGMEKGIGAAIIFASRKLARDLEKTVFGERVSFVYNPLVYARRPFEAFLRNFADSRKRVVFLGMNPGPWGMAQTGIPFGAVEMVRSWLGIEEAISRPPREHPRLPVLGFDCPRSEVSGTRLWSLMRERYATAKAFSRENLVINYCPLLFLDADGRNITPDKLRRQDRDRLYDVCDRHLAKVLKLIAPEWAVGIGRFAVECLQRIQTAMHVRLKIASIPHPSPANPAANRNWAFQATRALVGAGVWR
jgi:single-strand selective monofunctional uracil DNA glycosylase